MAKLSLTDFVSRSIGRHGSFYDYSLVSFKTVRDKISIICPAHGEFRQVARDHMSGSGCRDCAVFKSRLSFEEFVERSIIAHGGRYEYSSKDFYKSRSALVICSEHGEFWQDKYRHSQGEGCGKCFRKNSRLTVDEFVDRAKAVHGERYDYSTVKFFSSRDKVEIVCLEHGSFELFIYNHLNGNGCPDCRTFGRSRGEEELACFIEPLGFDVIRNDRSVLEGKEIDVYIPSLLVGFEFNGDYWHSDAMILKTRGVTSKEFDDLKSDKAKLSGVTLYFVKEKDWSSSCEEVKHDITSLLYSGEESPLFI